MRTLGRTARGHEPDVLGPTAEVSQHETYRREWIGRDGNAGARLGAALGQQRLAMRAVLLAGAMQFTVTADVELQMGFGNPLTGRLRVLGAPMSIGSDVEITTRPDIFGIIRTTLQTQRNIDHMQSLRKTSKANEKISITCREAFAWATVNGAKMVGLDHSIGSLAVGKQADIVLVRKDDLNMFPVHDPLSSLVTQAGISNVDTVLIGGRVVKRGGQLLFANIAEKKAALQRSGERILRDFGELPRAA